MRVRRAARAPLRRLRVAANRWEGSKSKRHEFPRKVQGGVARATQDAHPRGARDPPAEPDHDECLLVLFVERGSERLLGAQMVGGESVAGRINVLATALHSGMTAAQLEALDLAYAPPLAPVYDPVLIAASVARKVLRAPTGPARRCPG